MQALRSSWRPQPHQAAVLAHDAGIDLCVGGVGAGKSQVAALKVLRWVGRHPRKRDGRPARGLVLGKDFRNAGGTQFLAIRERVAELGLPERAVIVEERGPAADHAPYLRFWNGVELHAYTGTDTDSTRSFEADFLWADEAECMNLLSFVTALGRLRAAESMRAIVTSNPAGGGWIYPMLTGDVPEWDEIRRVNDVRVFRWASRQNKHLDAKVLATMGATYRAASPGLERQELGGRFLGTAEAPGSEVLEYVRAFVGKIEIPPDGTRAAVVGVDLGMSEDYVWMTALSRAGVALAMERFNLGEVDVDRLLFWPLVASRLLQFCATWGAGRLVIDSARGGDAFAALLREHARSVGNEILIDDYPTEKKKTALFQALSRAISMGRVVVPSSWRTATGIEGSLGHGGSLAERLRLEFKKLVKIGHGERVRYDHPPGGHDDGIVSLGLAWHGLSTAPEDAPRDLGSFLPSRSPALAPAVQSFAPPQPGGLFGLPSLGTSFF